MDDDQNDINTQIRANMQDLENRIAELETRLGDRFKTETYSAGPGNESETV